MLYKRYSGEFLSRRGHTYRAEIWQEASAPFSTIGELTFPAEEPLQIEWNEVDKEEPVIPSICTLQIESPADRTYIDLYTIKPGNVRLDVYRDDALFWSGTLDPETYEEPYERSFGYDVTLTFYDLGLLDRLKWLPADAEEAMPTLEWYINYIISRAAINVGALDTSLISTTTTDGKTILPNLRIRTDNFTDEDGENSDLKQMLTDLLQPLALRIIQRGGRLWLYDLNGLYTKSTPEAATWDGDSQTLGTDVVYNNVRITFSPYADKSLLNGDDFALPSTWYDTSQVNMFKAADDDEMATRKVFSYVQDYSSDVANQEVGGPYSSDGIQRVDFTLHLCGYKTRCAPLTIDTECGSRPRLLHIEPNYGSATATDCVAALMWEGGLTYDSTTKTWSCPHLDHRNIVKATAGFSDSGTNTAMRASDTAKLYPLFTTDSILLPPMADTKNLFLRLKLPMFLDVRYNPFEDASENNDQSRYDPFNSSSNVCCAYVPVRIVVKDAEGNVVLHYSNENLLYKNQAKAHAGIPVGSTPQTYSGNTLLIADYLTGGWYVGDTPTNGATAWLSYYKLKDNVFDGGVFSSWTNNKRCVRPASGESAIRVSLVAEDNMEGEYIPYPPSSYIPTGGYIEVQVLAGLRIFAAYFMDAAAMASDDFGACDWLASNYGMYSLHYKDSAKTYEGPAALRWQLFKCPTLELVKRTGAEADEETDDVEYSGYINKDAYDELSLDTSCGTLPSPCTTARGSYFYGGGQLTNLKRADITAPPEKLLIGTLISQYRDRRTTLEGEALTPEPTLTTYTERSQNAATLFLLKEEVLNAIADTSDIKLVELRPDEVTEIEEVEE